MPWPLHRSPADNRKGSRRPARRARPLLEALEDRITPSTVLFDPDGPAGPNGALSVASFDEAPGNLLAIGGVSALATFAANDTDGDGEFDPGETPTLFDAVYQARVVFLNGPSGPLVVPGLNEPPFGTGTPTSGAVPFELTVVARFTQQVTSVTALPGGASVAAFQVVPGASSFFEIWFDDGSVAGATPSSDLAGTGFNDGRLILAGTVTSGFSFFNATNTAAPYDNLDNFPVGDDDYPLIDSIAGNGASNDIAGPVASTDPGFFVDSAPTFISSSSTDTSQTTPFDSVDPSDQFVLAASGSAGFTGVGATADVGADTVLAQSTVGAVNGLSGPDIQIETDAQTELVTEEEPPQGGEGFTPGFWRSHLSDWALTGYSPTDSFETVFGVDLTGSLDGLTLEEGVNLGGGGERALIRHAVAGLLNAAHPNVDYDLTVAEVIQLVQDAYAGFISFNDAKDILEAFNEQGGDINS